ncbi:MAG: hypothetical protein IKE05_03520 [Clostridia bacterium]|nr:hypothetical protein [Clostridia bacterium]
MAENNIDKMSENQGKEVSGGYWGKDHILDEKYDAIYEELGIKHAKSKVSKDLYIYNGEQITKKQAYEMVDNWYREHGLDKK